MASCRLQLARQPSPACDCHLQLRGRRRSRKRNLRARIRHRGCWRGRRGCSWGRAPRGPCPVQLIPIPGATLPWWHAGAASGWARVLAKMCGCPSAGAGPMPCRCASARPEDTFPVRPSLLLPLLSHTNHSALPSSASSSIAEGASDPPLMLSSKLLLPLLSVRTDLLHTAFGFPCLVEGMLDTRHHAACATRGGGRSFRHPPRSTPRERATLGACLAVLPGRLVLSRRPGTRHKRYPEDSSLTQACPSHFESDFRPRVIPQATECRWARRAGHEAWCLARCASLRPEGRTPARSCRLVAERFALAFLCQEGEPRSNAIFAREKRGGGSAWGAERSC